MNAPWRHHSVPQFLLRNFSDADGLLYQRDRRRPDLGTRQLGPKGIFYERDQYSSVDMDTGQLDPSLEHFFDREVEGPAKPVVEKIVAAARHKQVPGLTAREKSILDHLLQFQSKRAPEMVRMNKAASEVALDRIMADLARLHGPLPEDLTSPASRALDLGIAESNGQLESVQPSFAFGESGFVGVGATIYFPQ